jgi:hypothetical protein
VADREEAAREHGLLLVDPDDGPAEVDAVVLASPHATFLDDTERYVYASLRHDGVVVDIKAKLIGSERVWTL